MHAPVLELAAYQVLQAFHGDAPGLFLGAMIVAAGLVAAAFSAIRRKHDPILIYFALFAALYGFRRWIKADLLYLTLQGWWVFPSSPVRNRLRRSPSGVSVFQRRWASRLLVQFFIRSLAF